MAKGQKKSNKEVRKPKAEKPKPKTEKPKPKAWTTLKFDKVTGTYAEFLKSVTSGRAPYSD